MTDHPRLPLRRLPKAATLRGAMSALGAAWTAYTIRRAMADVSSTSQDAYSDFGLDKVDILAALGRLHAQVAIAAARLDAPRPARII